MKIFVYPYNCKNKSLICYLSASYKSRSLFSNYCVSILNVSKDLYNF